MYVAANERSHLDAVQISTLQTGNLIVLIVVWNSLHTHSNLCITFVIAGKFDEKITRNKLILFILQPKLREEKETNNL